MIFTKSASLGTLVIGFTAVTTLVKSTADTEEMAGYALGTAELDICLHLNNQAVKFST
jgi:hypothetical protein